MALARSLKTYMEDNKFQYEILQHAPAVTAMRIAAAAHVPGDALAKCVVLEDEAGYVLAVIPSTHRLDIDKVSHRLHRDLRMAPEMELADLFDDCELGAIPPVGEAYGVETICDESLMRQPDVYFEGGTHSELIHMSGDQFRELMFYAEHGRISHHV